MLDYLADCHDDTNCEAAARLIDHAVQTGFESKRLRPMEFGGDMGTKAVTEEVISLVSEQK